MTKTIYRIAIYAHSTSLCDTLASLAAKFNGEQNNLSLNDFKTVAEANVIQYPSLNEGCKVEVLGDDLIHIERTIIKYSGEKETHTIMSIQKVEVMELEQPEMTPEQAREFLEGMQEAPTLSRTGINDKGNMEALN